MFTLSPAGKELPRKAVEAIYNGALESGVPAKAIHMGGPPVDNVALDKEGERMLLLLAGLSGIVGLGLSWWFMQNGRLVGFVIFSRVYSAAHQSGHRHVYRQHDGLDPAEHALDRLHDGHVRGDPHHQLLAAQRRRIWHGRGPQRGA